MPGPVPSHIVISSFFVLRASRSTMPALAALALAALIGAPSARAEKAYDPGASDSEILLGYIGSDASWASAYRVVERAEAAYFQMVNDQGGVGGRKIRLLAVSSGSEASAALDAARQLVDRDGVLLVFSPIGTESNLAIRGFLNERKVPQLFVESSSAAFDDPSHFPWTMGFFTTYRTEGRLYATYILRERPAGKIAVLYPDNATGKEFLDGVQAGLGDRASAMIVKALAYRPEKATIEPQIRALRSTGADIFLNLTLGAFVTEAIRTAYDMDWHPLQFIPNASVSTAAFLDPAGLEKARGIIANARSKSWTGLQAQGDPAVRLFLAWMSKYNPDASLRDQNYVAGYERAQAMVEVLRKCGDNLTRANVMKQAASLDLELGMFRPGIRIKTSPSDYQPIKELFLIRFNGRSWTPVGPVVGD
jgi:branched-chain amino acid transport system substrate-binding protein